MAELHPRFTTPNPITNPEHIIRQRQKIAARYLPDARELAAREKQQTERTVKHLAKKYGVDEGAQR